VPDEARCALCQRDRPLTFHHLIPKALHRRKRYARTYTKDELARGIDVCRDCHDAVHRFLDEKELGERYHTVEALLAHPEVARFVAWVSTRGGRHRLR
jgi:5-methylcytosine-specific restriction endonuclease McrA